MIHSNRLECTESPYIEDILEKYSAAQGVTKLALGSSYWNPPKECLEALMDNQLRSSISSICRYGPILGDHRLLQEIRNLMEERGLAMKNMNICITCGANLAFMLTALATCDQNDIIGTLDTIDCSSNDIDFVLQC